jgi:hypothetical protein
LEQADFPPFPDLDKTLLGRRCHHFTKITPTPWLPSSPSSPSSSPSSSISLFSLSSSPSGSVSLFSQLLTDLKESLEMALEACNRYQSICTLTRLGQTHLRVLHLRRAQCSINQVIRSALGQPGLPLSVDEIPPTILMNTLLPCSRGLSRADAQPLGRAKPETGQGSDYAGPES